MPLEWFRAKLQGFVKRLKGRSIENLVSSFWRHFCLCGKQFKELLHKLSRIFQSLLLLGCHRIGIKMHYVVANLPDLFELFRQTNFIYLERKLLPEVWMLK